GRAGRPAGCFRHPPPRRGRRPRTTPEPRARPPEYRTFPGGPCLLPWVGGNGDRPRPARGRRCPRSPVLIMDRRTEIFPELVNFFGRGLRVSPWATLSRASR